MAEHSTLLALAAGQLWGCSCPQLSLEHWLQNGGSQVPLTSQTEAGPEGCRQPGTTSYLGRYLPKNVQGRRVLLGWAELVWPHVDGRLGGSHLAGGGVPGDVLQEDEQVLEQEVLGFGQLAGHPVGTGTQP